MKESATGERAYDFMRSSLVGLSFTSINCCKRKKVGVFSVKQAVYTDGVLTVGTYWTETASFWRMHPAEKDCAPTAPRFESYAHAVGDPSGNIGTGALKAFASRLMGYNIVTGVYTLRGEGKDLYLTIDANLNEAAYKALDGRKGAVGVMNYKTGDIICMVSSPTFDPLNTPDFENTGEQYEGVFLNRFISSAYTPGSTFKLITLAAAIENIPDLYDRAFTCGGSLNIGGDTVKCTKKHGNCP